jgi:hypothetical protein
VLDKIPEDLKIDFMMAKYLKTVLGSQVFKKVNEEK